MKIKKITKNKVKELKEFMNNPTILKEIGFYKSTYTTKEARKALEGSSKYRFGIFEKEKIIGRIELTTKKTPRIFDIEYIISPKYRRKGLAKWAIKEICKKAFKEFKAIRINARVEPENKISQKILRNEGFKLEGRLRKSFYINKKYKDELVFGKIK